MKNASKKLAILSSTLMMGFSLISCGDNNNLIRLDYGNIHSYNIQNLNEIPEQTYDSLTSAIKNAESFMLMIYNDTAGCGDCWANFQRVLVEFVNEYHVDVMYIGRSQIVDKADTYDLYLVAGDLPSIAYFKRGKLIRQTTYISQNENDRKIFNSYKSFIEHINKNVILPKIYYLDKDVLDKKISNNEEFTLYLGRNGCPDCRQVNNGFLHNWVDSLKGSEQENLYIFDLQEYYGTDQYQGLKDLYGMSNVNNPVLGYSTGMVPTFQHRKGSEVKDMVVVYNDYFPKDSNKLVSYFTQERVNAMPFLKDKEGDFVLDGKTFSDSDKANWRDSVQAEKHNPILQLFFDEYLK